MKQIVFATNNKNKLREMREIMEGLYEVLSLEDIGCHEDIVEDADTIEGNAKIKADFVTNKFHVDCFADDTGLEVEILGGAPGVHTARYGGPQKDPAANIARLLREMACREQEASVARGMGLSTPKATRKARFRTSVTLILNGEKHFFDGIMEGRIAREKAGKGGFGYDPVFIPDGYDVTAAEITEEEKNAISHRGKALRAMAEFLKSR